MGHPLSPEARKVLKQSQSPLEKECCVLVSEFSLLSFFDRTFDENFATKCLRVFYVECRRETLSYLHTQLSDQKLLGLFVVVSTKTQTCFCSRANSFWHFNFFSVFFKQKKDVRFYVSIETFSFKGRVGGSPI